MSNPIDVKEGDVLEVYDAYVTPPWVKSIVTDVIGPRDYYLRPTDKPSINSRYYRSICRDIRQPQHTLSPKHEFEPGKCPVFVAKASYPTQCEKCGMGTGGHPAPPKKLSEQVAAMEADLAASRAQFAERADACRRYEAEKTRWTGNARGYDTERAARVSAEANVQRLAKELAEAVKVGKAHEDRANRLADRVTALEAVEKAAKYIVQRIDEQIGQSGKMTGNGRRKCSYHVQSALVEFERLLEKQSTATAFQPQPTSMPKQAKERLEAIRQVMKVGKDRVHSGFNLLDAKRILGSFDGDVQKAEDYVRRSADALFSHISAREKARKSESKPMHPVHNIFCLCAACQDFMRRGGAR